MGDMDWEKPILPKWDFDEFHECVKYIMKTNEIIFYLLTISSFENIRFKQPKLAKYFLNNLIDNLEKHPNSINYSNIKNLVNTLSKIKLGIHDKRLVDGESIIDTPNIVKIECNKCESEYIQGSECTFCHIQNCSNIRNIKNVIFWAS